jgi:hypothetical protein
MNEKQNLLIVGDYGRNDVLKDLELIYIKANLFFIEFETPKALTNDNYKSYGTAVFWKDFSDAFTLLEKLKINKVVFYVFESFKHIALRTAGLQLCIPCWHLEHGFRSYEIQKGIAPPVKFVSFFKKKVILLKMFFYSNFYKNTWFKSTKRFREQLSQYYVLRALNTPFNTFEGLECEILKLDFYINFVPQNFDFFIKNHKLGDSFSNVSFIGIPKFDELALQSTKDIELNTNAILFIEENLAAQSLYGWNYENTKYLLDRLVEKTTEWDMSLVVKLHPLTKPDFFKQFKCSFASDDFNNSFNYKYIIGFNSTMLLPLAAFRSVTIFCLKAPDPNHDYKNHLVESKVAWELLTIDHLTQNMLDIPIDENARLNYIEEWLYEFDGMSGQRLLSLLTS